MTLLALLIVLVAGVVGVGVLRQVSREPARAGEPPLMGQFFQDPIDLPDFTSRCQHDPGFENKLLTIFLSQSQKNLRRLGDSLNRGDLPGAARAAHAIKGSAAYCSARVVQALAGQIEDRASVGDSVRARRLLIELHRAFDDCRAFIGSRLQVRLAA